MPEDNDDSAKAASGPGAAGEPSEGDQPTDQVRVGSGSVDPPTSSEQTGRISDVPLSDSQADTTPPGSLPPKSANGANSAGSSNTDQDNSAAQSNGVDQGKSASSAAYGESTERITPVWPTKHPWEMDQPESEAERTQDIRPVVAAPVPFSESAPSPTTGTARTEPVREGGSAGFPHGGSPDGSQDTRFQATNRIGGTSAASTASWSIGGDLHQTNPGPANPGQPNSGQQGPRPARPEPDNGVDDKKRRGWVRPAIVAGIAAAVLTVLYIGDLVFTSGQVPRGTAVADVEVGGMSPAAAERKLRSTLGPSLHEPVQLRAGDSVAQIDPAQAGLRMDWHATLERAGAQPLNPITRVTSFFANRDITPVSRGDRAQLAAALREVKPALDRAPKEGGIRFEGVRPVAAQPVTGRDVNVAEATDVVLAQWAKRAPVQVPHAEQPVSTTSAGVHKALTEVAQPAVSAPVVVRGEGKEATLTPEAVAAALKFVPDGNGGLKPRIDVPKAAAAVHPQLVSTMRPAVDARVALEGGKPVVHPSVDGRGIDWNKSFARLPETLKRTGDRGLQAVYAHQPPRFTTDQANKLGIREVVSEFQTGGFEPSSGMNIRRVAEQVNGAIVRPGETFSLNGHTGPRGLAQGYVESGIIEDGRPAKAVGGGISQFATTLYNASYFAAMKDIEHKEHSYFISRYPPGREATVFQNPDGSSVIDVKFKNTSPSGVMITTEWTPSSIKIKFWSTKHYDVSSHTGPRTNPTPPQEKMVPPGQPCSSSKGTPGFTVQDTRTVKEVGTGKVVAVEPSTTKYSPQPIIHCGPPPPR